MEKETIIKYLQYQKRNFRGGTYIDSIVFHDHVVIALIAEKFGCTEKDVIIEDIDFINKFVKELDDITNESNKEKQAIKEKEQIEINNKNARLI